MLPIYQALAKLAVNSQPGVLCTIVYTQGSTPRHEGSKMLVYPGGEILGTIGGGELEHRIIREALETLKIGKPKEVEYSMVDPDRGDPGICGGQIRIFIEPILPTTQLVIFGCGHVGREVAHLGKWLGFKVIVCDDQPELCNPTNIPDADEYHVGYKEILGDDQQLTPWTFVVLTTRDLEIDVSVLPNILASEVGYIGVIGSRRRWATTSKELLELGISEKQLKRIHSPIGLDLRAESPREIAMSILAEIISVQKQGDGESLSEGNTKTRKN